MNRLNEPPDDGFDFEIYNFRLNDDGTASASGKCDNGATVGVDMRCIVDDGVILIEGCVSIDFQRWGDSGTKYTELSIKDGITVKDAETCIRAFMDENMDLN